MLIWFRVALFGLIFLPLAGYAQNVDEDRLETEGSDKIGMSFGALMGLLHYDTIFPLSFVLEIGPYLVISRDGIAGFRVGVAGGPSFSVSDDGREEIFLLDMHMRPRVDSFGAKFFILGEILYLAEIVV